MIITRFWYSPTQSTSFEVIVINVLFVFGHGGPKMPGVYSDQNVQTQPHSESKKR